MHLFEGEGHSGGVLQYSHQQDYHIKPPLLIAVRSVSLGAEYLIKSEDPVVFFLQDGKPLPGLILFVFFRCKVKYLHSFIQRARWRPDPEVRVVAREAVLGGNVRGLER